MASKKTIGEVETTSELGTVLNELVAQANASIPEGFMDEAQFLGQSIVPASPIPTTTQETLARLMGAAPLTQGEGKGISPAKMMAHYDKATYGKFQEALDFSGEDQNTPASIMGSGNTQIIVPPGTRDIPQSLYQIRDRRTGRLQNIKERADQILRVVFGETADRVEQAAARCGFDQKPLIWVSQQIWLHVNEDRQHNYKQYRKDVGTEDMDFGEFMDVASDSPVLKCLQSFLEVQTVRRLSVTAKYTFNEKEGGCSVLCLVRCIMTDVCSEFKVPKNWKNPVLAVDY